VRSVGLRVETDALDLGMDEAHHRLLRGPVGETGGAERPPQGEVAEDEESPLRSAMGHALLRVALEAVLFYTLLTLAIACGLSDGENGNHENDALAYLADTFVGGWGEPLLHALGCVMFVAACEITRGGIVVWMGMTSAGSKLAFVLRHLRIGRTEGSPIQIERASPAIT